MANSDEDGCYSRTIKRKFIASRILESESCVKKQKTLFDCPHCDKSLSENTFKKHKKLFYSQHDGSWKRATPAQLVVSTPEFTESETTLVINGEYSYAIRLARPNGYSWLHPCTKHIYVPNLLSAACATPSVSYRYT